MSALEIGLAIADLGIALMWPCSAITGPPTSFGPTVCGSTPASKYLRWCGVESHTRVVWICPVHVMLIMAGGSICKECAARGGITGIVSIERLSEPVRM